MSPNFLIRVVIGCLFVLIIIQPRATAAAEGPKPTLVTQTAHSGQVASLAVNADGTLLATGGDDATIKIWHVASRRVVRALRGHTNVVMSLAFHPSRQVLASAGAWDSSVALWDLERNEKRELKGLDVSYGNLAFSPDGEWLIHGGPTGVVVWEVSTGRMNKIDADPVEAIALSRDGVLLVTGDNRGTIKVRRGVTGDAASTFSARPGLVQRTGRHGGVFALAVSPNNEWLAAAGATVDVWDLKTLTHLRTLGEPVVSVQRPLAFSPDGSKLAAAHNNHHAGQQQTTAGAGDDVENSDITLWDTATWKVAGALAAHTDAVNAINFNPADRNLLVSAGRDGAIRFWDVKKRAQGINPTHNIGPVTWAKFTPNGQQLAVGAGREVTIWDLKRGSPRFVLSGHQQAMTAADIAKLEDGEVIITGGADGAVKIWDALTGKLRRRIDGSQMELRCLTVSPDGSTLAAGGERAHGTGPDQRSGLITLFSLPTGDKRKEISAHAGGVTSLAFSADGKTLVSGSVLLTREGKIPEGDSTVRFWDVSSGRELPTPIGPQKTSVKALAFATEGNMLAVGRAAMDLSNPAKIFLGLGETTITEEDAVTGETLSKKVIKQEMAEVSNQDLRLWDVSGRPLHTDPYSGIVNALSFLPGGRTLVTGGADTTVRLWDVNSGRISDTLSGHSAPVNAVTISPNGDIMATGAQDGTVVLWKLDGKQEAARLAHLGEDGWIVFQADGRFDTNNLEEITGLQWVFPDEPFKPLSPEIFLRQYYEPRLLPRSFDPESKFELVPPLGSLNRAQPRVEIKSVIAGRSSPGFVTVLVTVARPDDGTLHGGGRGVADSGVYDLRLFRDGQLVGYRPGRVRLSRSGSATVPFRVKLPGLRTPSEVEFTAYAFNADRVKSSTAKYAYKPPQTRPPIKGSAYVISVGINAYEDEAWDLAFAATDAWVTSGALIDGLRATGAYREVTPITLISDYSMGAGGRIVTEKAATKQNFRAVLDKLAGRQPARPALKGVPGAHRLRKADPNDLVLIAFSSHGYTDRRGKFYLIPFDTGGVIKYDAGGQEIAPASLSHFISSDELSEWVRDIDAGELVMVVDTCHSAAAVEEPGFKPGPMGARGMGQLAYDKGMRVLAASQADDVALEIRKLKQGLLTYALVREGLERRKADSNNDDKVTMEEWLEYGLERVPELYADLKAGRLEEIKSKDLRITAVLAGTSVRKNAFQQPQLFDFKRKKREILISRLSRR